MMPGLSPVPFLKKLDKDITFSNIRRKNVFRTAAGFVLVSFLMIQVVLLRAESIRYWGIIITVGLIFIYAIVNIIIGAGLRESLYISRYKSRALDNKIRVYTAAMIFFLLATTVPAGALTTQYYQSHRYFDFYGSEADNITEARMIGLAEGFGHWAELGIDRYDGDTLRIGKLSTQCPNYIDRVSKERYYREFTELKQKQAEGMYGIGCGASAEFPAHITIDISRDDSGKLRSGIDTSVIWSRDNITLDEIDTLVYFDGYKYNKLEESDTGAPGFEFKLNLQDVYIVDQYLGFVENLYRTTGFILSQYTVIEPGGGIVLIFTMRNVYE